MRAQAARLDPAIARLHELNHIRSRQFEFFTSPSGFVPAEPGWTAIIWSGDVGAFPVCTPPVIGWLASPCRAHPIVPGAYNELAETYGGNRYH